MSVVLSILYIFIGLLTIVHSTVLCVEIMALRIMALPEILINETNTQYIINTVYLFFCLLFFAIGVVFVIYGIKKLHSILK